MAKAGPFRIPDLVVLENPRLQALDPEPVTLPPRPVLGAGLKKFQELAKLCWPNAACDGLVTFDVNNQQQLVYVLGLVYMAMKGADH